MGSSASDLDRRHTERAPASSAERLGLRLRRPPAPQRGEGGGGHIEQGPRGGGRAFGGRQREAHTHGRTRQVRYAQAAAAVRPHPSAAAAPHALPVILRSLPRTYGHTPATPRLACWPAACPTRKITPPHSTPSPTWAHRRRPATRPRPRPPRVGSSQGSRPAPRRPRQPLQPGLHPQAPLPRSRRPRRASTSEAPRRRACRCCRRRPPAASPAGRRLPESAGRRT